MRGRNGAGFVKGFLILVLISIVLTDLALLIQCSLNLSDIGIQNLLFIESKMRINTVLNIL
jgi:hypothetical protein